MWNLCIITRYFAIEDCKLHNKQLYEKVNRYNNMRDTWLSWEDYIVNRGAISLLEISSGLISSTRICADGLLVTVGTYLQRHYHWHLGRYFISY